MKLVSFDAFRTLRLPETHYIKPELFFTHLADLREADWVLFPEYWQINPLVFGLKRRIFPSLASYLIGHNKIEMTRAFMAVAPEHVPWTLTAPNDPTSAERLWQQMALPFVAKIPKSSMGEGVFLIESQDDWQRYLKLTPSLYVQEWLPIDRDLRIIWIGDRVIGGFWRRQSDQGFHNNLSRGGRIDHSPLPEAAVALVHRLATALDINHAGFDIAMVDGYPFVLEFNRLFGNRGLGSLNNDIPGVILDYLERQSGCNDPDDDPLRPTPIWPVAI
ncbi:hypothetical protein GCM10011348_09550 [Marinobacterium nitratireducens]|uniref:ATP-grasp fold RimK-type domain-containing protein n=1 Tax=Marinobacterium nitratireducens TaxID=518897 RepID=A0A918DQL4_9GAMM|nr:hypothetical protein [Marinobacterium nitratireducens]GGO78201.1 hypothetical protein GCM10011348_09550 [Marinobacterium nitratireducens]